MQHIPNNPDDVWMAVFLSRIDPATGAGMRPHDAAMVADEARQAYEARAAFWAQHRGEESDDEIPRIY